MTQRTRRATEAVESHYEFLRACHPGSPKDLIEGGLLDPARDKNDPRYGHEAYLYEGGHFQDWLSGIADRAMTFAVTTELMTEVVLTQEMMSEEGIDWLPLRPQHLPAESGLILFPFGVECPVHDDHGIRIGPRKMTARGVEQWVEDSGAGDRWMIDGFIWDRNDRVAADGHAGRPTNGVTIILLTRWRDRGEDRPFRLYTRFHGDLPVPELVGSDLTAWSFDDEGQTEWRDPEHLIDGPHEKAEYERLLVKQRTGTDLSDEEISYLAKVRVEDESDVRDRVIEHLEAQRWWVRSLVWSCWRWLTDEVWTPERAERPVSRKMRRARPDFTDGSPDDGDVVIVDLRPERREAASTGSGEPPWWRTRWTVRGHWARRRVAIRDEAGQPVGPTRGPDAVEGETFAYRRVWIEPFVKGPDNAPLVVRDKVGVLNR